MAVRSTRKARITIDCRNSYSWYSIHVDVTLYGRVPPDGGPVSQRPAHSTSALLLGRESERERERETERERQRELCLLHICNKVTCRPHPPCALGGVQVFFHNSGGGGAIWQGTSPPPPPPPKSHLDSLAVPLIPLRRKLPLTAVAGCLIYEQARYNW